MAVAMGYPVAAATLMKIARSVPSRATPQRPYHSTSRTESVVTISATSGTPVRM